MSAVVFMLALGWVVVSLLAGIVIGSAIHLADEQQANADAPTERLDIFL